MSRKRSPSASARKKKKSTKKEPRLQEELTQYLPLSLMAREEQFKIFTEMHSSANNSNAQLSRVLESLSNIKLSTGSSKDSIGVFAKSNVDQFLTKRQWIDLCLSHFPDASNLKEVKETDPSDASTLRVLQNYYKYIKTHGINIYMKVRPKFTSPSSVFRNVEVKLSPIINELIFSRQTPHLMTVLGHFSTDDFSSIIHRVNTKNHGKNKGLVTLEQNVEEFKKSPLKKANVLISECGKGKTFHNWILDKAAKGNLTTEMVLPIIFQVLYTLFIMEYNVTHYNLTFRNIWIQDTSSHSSFQKEYKLQHEKPIFVYLLDSESYVVLPFKADTGFARLFNWDYGYAPGATSKKQDDSRTETVCEKSGICPELNPMSDMWSFLMSLSSYKELPKSVTKFAKDSLKTDIDVNYESHPYVTMMDCLKQKGNDKEKYCNRLKLCNVEEKEIEVKGKDKVVYACDGAYSSSDNVYDPLSILSEFLKKFKKHFHYFEFPEFDEKFLPGTLNWENCVFGESKESAGKNILDLYYKSRIDNVNFKALK